MNTTLKHCRAMAFKKHDTPINILTLPKVLIFYLRLLKGKVVGHEKPPCKPTWPRKKPPNKTLTIQ